jgi:type IV pilus assembly protein PilA
LTIGVYVQVLDDQAEIRYPNNLFSISGETGVQLAPGLADELFGSNYEPRGEPMLQTMKSRIAAGRHDEDGFTLIELMVVVLIIAILLAIAIPTFLGAQNKAKDRSAQSSLRNTITAAKTIYADSSDYTQASSANLSPIEPSLSFKANAVASTGPKEVSVLGSTMTLYYAASKSATGTCFYIRDDVTAGTAAGGTWFTTAVAPDVCTADGAKGTSQVWKNTGW